MFNINKLFKTLQSHLAEFMRTDDSTDYSFKHDFKKKENSIEEFQYRTGFLFYMDILGCKGLSLESSRDDVSMSKVKKIVDLFIEIERQYEDKHWTANYKMPFTNNGVTVDKHLGETDIEVTMSLFSDSIIISYYPKAADRFVLWYEQMHQIFNDICRTIYLFACHGFFLRGGMSYGRFYHCGNVCFGPALLEAVRLEDEICYPAIAIGDSFRKRIIEDLRSKEIDDYSPGYKEPHKLRVFAEDFFSIFIDGTYVKGQYKLILDCLLAVFFYHTDAIDVLKESIVEQISIEYPQKIKEKYIWLAKQFNHSLDGLTGLGIGDYSYAKIHLY